MKLLYVRKWAEFLLRSAFKCFLNGVGFGVWVGAFFFFFLFLVVCENHET